MGYETSLLQRDKAWQFVIRIWFLSQFSSGIPTPYMFLKIFIQIIHCQSRDTLKAWAPNPGPQSHPRNLTLNPAFSLA